MNERFRDLVIAALVGALIAIAAAWVATPATRAAAAWEALYDRVQQDALELQQQCRAAVADRDRRISDLETLLDGEQGGSGE